MERLERKINSEWIKKTGSWNKVTNTYDNVREVPRQKTLTMRITEERVEFDGGPTGYEAYNNNDYLVECLNKAINAGVWFTICGGTINKFARCSVPPAQVLKAINDFNAAK